MMPAERRGPVAFILRGFNQAHLFSQKILKLKKFNNHKINKIVRRVYNVTDKIHEGFKRPAVIEG